MTIYDIKGAGGGVTGAPRKSNKMTAKRGDPKPKPGTAKRGVVKPLVKPLGLHNPRIHKSVAPTPKARKSLVVSPRRSTRHTLGEYINAAIGDLARSPTPSMSTAANTNKPAYDGTGNIYALLADAPDDLPTATSTPFSGSSSEFPPLVCDAPAKRESERSSASTPWTLTSPAASRSPSPTRRNPKRRKIGASTHDKLIAEAENLARRATDFADPLTNLCRDVPGTAPGTKITEVNFTGAPGKRLDDMKRNIQPLLGKAFGSTLLNDEKTFFRVGDKMRRNRYVGTCSKFGRGGPMFAYLQSFLEKNFCPALHEAFPDAILSVAVSGMHVFLGIDAKFHMHPDEMGSCPEQVMFLIHVGHTGVWVQDTGVEGENQSRVERSHGCVISMDKNARVLRHGFSDPKGLGATLLFTVDLKDGADHETIDQIRRHLAVAVNAVMLSFDAETAKPDSSLLAADGGPLAMAWGKFSKDCLSSINSRRGKKGRETMAARHDAVKLVEGLRLKGIQPEPEQAAKAAEALPSVQKERDTLKEARKTMAARHDAVKMVEGLRLKGIQPEPEQAAKAAEALDPVQRQRDGGTKGRKQMADARAAVAAGDETVTDEQRDSVARERVKVRRGGAGGGTRKIRNTKGSRPFVIMYRKVHENEQPRECIGSLSDGKVSLCIDDKYDPVLFAITTECGYKEDAHGQVKLSLKFNEGPAGRFVFKTPTLYYRTAKNSAFFERCTIISGRLLTSEELAENANEASKHRLKCAKAKKARKRGAKAASAVGD